MIVALDTALLAVAGFFLCYLFTLTLLAFTARLRTGFPASRQRRFAIVVPAHNEERSLGKTLASLTAIAYPRDDFDVIVVADNCTDRTADIARASGVLVKERTNPVERGKGYALRWCFDQLLVDPRGYDAVVVIDADSVASSNYLAVLNYYLDRGARALQTSDLVDPQPGVWSAEATRLGFMLYNYVRPLGRNVIGAQAGARGNGMCFSVEALRAVPWTAFSRNEDLEYGLTLLLHGIPVMFAPEALVLATMPSNAKNAESQRARWEGGRFPVIRRMAAPLLLRSITRSSFQSFDAFVELVTPALVNLMAFTIVMALLTAIAWMFGLEGAGVLTILWCCCLMLGFFHVLLGIVVSRDQSLMQTVIHIPRYVIWKILLYAGLVRKKGSDDEWVRTTRE